MLVEVEDLTVRYGELTAVDRISFSAEAGQVTAVLGPNGAGKTSTLEVCEGYRWATSGTVRVLGLDPATDQRRLGERVGVMLQEGGVYPAARVAESVAHYCALYGRGVDPRALVEQVGLADRATTSWRRLSGGERQRLSLALALAARPEVAFLDEPTSGVDVNGRDTIRGILRRLAADGCAVVLATHELDEAERVADRVIIVDRGTVVADGTLDDLRRGHDEIRFRSVAGLDLEVLGAVLGRPVTAITAITDTGTGPRTTYDPAGSTVAPASGSGPGSSATTGPPGEYAVAGTSDPRVVAALTSWLVAGGHPLYDLRAGAQRLEDVFRRLTGGSAP